MWLFLCILKEILIIPLFKSLQETANYEDAVKLKKHINCYYFWIRQSTLNTLRIRFSSSSS